MYNIKFYNLSIEKYDLEKHRYFFHMVYCKLPIIYRDQNSVYSII